MWLPRVICLLLACMATTHAAESNSTEQERPKRDLQFWKDLLAAKLGLTPPKPVLKEEDVKILRIPGFDQVLVRAVPRVTVVEAPMPERIVQVDPTMTLIGSYLGTKSAEETIFALQNMKQLVQSGVMKAREEVIELAPPPPPVYVLQPQIVQQKLNWPEPRPVYPIFERTIVPVPQPLPVLPPIPLLPPPPPPPPAPLPVLPYFPVLPPPPPVPMPPPAKLIPVPPPKIVVPEIRPMPLPVPLPPPVVPVFPTTYSYKQGYADGSVTTYYSEGNQDVIVTETHEPPPPLPAFIIERLGNIIYGRPTGSLVPAGEVVGPIYPEPVLPIVTGPSNVEVKLYSDRPHKLPEADSSNFSYKRVHSDGTISTFSGTASTKQPLEQRNRISKLPSPPPAILERIQAFSGQAYTPKAWGYSVKTSDGVSSYETLDGGKIFYSHLESPSSSPDSSVFPAALSSPTDDQPKSPIKNVIFIENDTYDEGTQGRPASNSEKETTTRPEIEPMKKIPALPTPIAGESHNSARYSYKIVHNPNYSDGTKITFSTQTPSTPELAPNKEYHGFGTNGFSYTQVNHDGTVDMFTGNEVETKPAVAMEAIKKIPPLPSPIAGDQSKTKSSPVIINLGEEQNSGFSYTQIDKAGSVTTISGDGNVKMPAPTLVSEAVPVQPAAIIDVIQPVAKAPCKSQKKCKKPASTSSEASGFSYTQISNQGSVTKFTGDGQVQIPVAEVVEVPAPPAAIIDVIQPIPNPVLIEVDKKQEVEVFPRPVWSNYVYKQISHTNPQPFTVVKVGNGPDFEVPTGEVKVKVNKHEHVRPDGTRYPCMEVHKVVPDAPIPPIPTSQMVSTIPEGLMYVPPENEKGENSLPNSHKVEVHSAGSHFSYTQVSGDSSSEAPAISSEASSVQPMSLSLNPIVVGPVDSTYSYTQKNSDGSSLSVQGDRDNTVSVKIDDGELKTSDAGRGDIP